MFYRSLGFVVWKIFKRIVQRKAPVPVGRKSRGRAIPVVIGVATVAIAVAAGFVKARSGGATQLTP